MNIRELVLDMLLEMERERVYSNLLIRRVLDKYDDLPGKDKAFIKRVTEGTLERRIQIDYIMDQFSKTPSGKMKPLIRNLLRMSVYQILFMDAVPDSAACNEAVKLAAKRKFQSLKGFVNGVLRNIAREKDMILSAGGKEGFYPDREKEPLAYLSVFYSMPEYFIVMWLEEYGMERTEKMLQAMLEVRPVTIRIRESLTEKEKEALLRDMGEAGIGAEQHPYLPYAYMLEHAEGVRNIPGFDEEILKQMVSDAEDVTEKIAEYGTLDDEEIQRMKDSAVRKEQKIQQTTPESAGEPVPDPGIPVTIRQESPDGEEAAEIRKSIICPECGKKIWL